MGHWKRTLFVVLAVAPGWASDPASVTLYFPEIAAGGSPAGEQWQTVLTFTNPSPASAAIIRTKFYGSEGQSADLGFGDREVTVPPGGERTLTSRIGGQAVTGSAIAASPVPVLAAATLRRFRAGRLELEVAESAVRPIAGYTAFARLSAQVAIVNISTQCPAPVQVVLRNLNGEALDTRRMEIPPLRREFFNASEAFGLDDGFAGTLDIEPAGPLRQHLIAWDITPASEWGYIWRVFRRVMNTARQVFPDAYREPVALRITAEDQVSAFARDGNSIRISFATARMTADSESELAFVIAHEVAHIKQRRTGRLSFSRNEELDADALGSLFLIGAGYDPYAAAGVFGKLQMASGEPGLSGEQNREESNDPHKSFSTRIGSVLEALRKVCESDSAVAKACDGYRGGFRSDRYTTLPGEGMAALTR